MVAPRWSGRAASVRKPSLSQRIKEEESMNRAIRKLAPRSSRGQGMTEYIIIVALIAVAAIGTYNYLGRTLRNQTGAIAAGLAGDQPNATAAMDSAKKAGGNAQKEAATSKGLQNFATEVGNR
jgi:Flp pilus assembly pilin Flp